MTRGDLIAGETLSDDRVSSVGEDSANREMPQRDLAEEKRPTDHHHHPTQPKPKPEDERLKPIMHLSTPPGHDD